jgi:hypothetical protein
VTDRNSAASFIVLRPFRAERGRLRLANYGFLRGMHFDDFNHAGSTAFRGFRNDVNPPVASSLRKDSTNEASGSPFHRIAHRLVDDIDGEWTDSIGPKSL